MSTVPEVDLPERVRAGFSDVTEIEEFVATLERFENGEITADQWRAYRLVRGLYGQRQGADLQMLRVKVPQGLLGADQLRVLGRVARAHSRGFGHVTTRQNVQFHFMKLAEVESALRALADAGLTTREACGNSVRNITACPLAGVAADEVFDVTPYAEALTRYLLRHPLSSVLPRKFKIAWEGCPEDHAVLAIHDLAFQARLGPGGSRRGFTVLAGGGTSILCRPAQVLFDFVPAAELLNVAEAVLRVYHSRGDFQHKQRNRLKFLIDQMGFGSWQEEVESTLRTLRRQGGASLPFDPDNPPLEDAPRTSRKRPPDVEALEHLLSAEELRGPGIVPGPWLRRGSPEDFTLWRHRSVRPQKQTGYATVTVELPLGDFTAAQMDALAALSESYADATARLTSSQNLVFRWVPSEALADLHARLLAAGLGGTGAGTVADVVSCPGAESCRLAVTQSRGLGKLLGDHLRERPEVVAAAGDLDIRISGCPNGCSRHHIAALGFQGSVRRLGSKALPQYFVMVGGGGPAGDVRFGRTVAKVPSRRIPEAVERLVALYAAERLPGETTTAFFRRLPAERAKELLADLERVTAEEARASDFVDLGEEREFAVETMEGECSA